MPAITKKEITKFIEKNIKSYHEKLLDNLIKLKLENVLKRKNPYLFKVKNIKTAEELIRSILSAHLSSQEEGIFGNFLEELAIFICGKVFRGRKSSAQGIDLEFEKNGDKYLVAIKSGPNWGNSEQIRRMKDSFIKAKRILGTSSSKTRNIICVNGCCYGVDDRPNKGDYLKLCGQRFWEFISDNKNLYIEIIEPLGHKAKDKNAKFLSEYNKVVKSFIPILEAGYCKKGGTIDWENLVKFNSGKKKP